MVSAWAKNALFSKWRSTPKLTQLALPDSRLIQDYSTSTDLDFTRVRLTKRQPTAGSQVRPKSSDS